MLTKDSRKILDFLNRTTPNLEGNFFEISYVSSRLNLDYMNVLSICETLAIDNYVTFADRQKTTIRVLEKGRNYKDLKHQEIMQFLKRSVLVPFVVSVATSVATVYITKLLSLF